MNIQIARDGSCALGKAAVRFESSAGVLQVSDGLFLAVPPQSGPTAPDLFPQVAGYVLSVELPTDRVRIWPTKPSTFTAAGASRKSVMLCVTLNSLAEQAAQTEMMFVGLEATGEPLVEATIASLTRCLLESLARGEQGRSFAGKIADTLCLHLVACCGRTVARCDVKGGLAPWQQRRVQEIVRKGLSRPIRIAELARACELSSSHFSHAFRCSVGEPPHRWILGRRVEKAKNLLRAKELQFAAIAVDCGFSDQSHFSRTFARFTGLTPRQWQRAVRSI